MIAYAVRRGIRVSTGSNLALLNPNRAERCVTTGLDMLHISIDGARPETCAAIRVRGKLERVLANVRLVTEARARLSSTRPRLRMVVVVMRKNLAELPELVRLAHELTIPTIFVQHLCHNFGEASLPIHYAPMREFVSEQTLLAEDTGRVELYFSQARAVAAELGIDLRLPSTQPRLHPPGTPGPERCNWPWRGAYVSYQGLAMPCCMVATPDRIHLGDMARDDAEAVWNGAAYQDFRTRLSSDTPPEVCASCSLYAGTF